MSVLLEKNPGKMKITVKIVFINARSLHIYNICAYYYHYTELSGFSNLVGDTVLTIFISKRLFDVLVIK